jgi:type VI secretion system protein ImpC
LSLNLERMLASSGTPVGELTDRDIADAFARLLRSSSFVASDTWAQVNGWIDELDQLLSGQLDEILHSPGFQRLESAWRGLWLLVDRTETSNQLKIRLLNASKLDLCEDVCGTEDIEETHAFQLVHDLEFGIFGGEPYGVLIGDYAFSHHPDDLQLLSRISQLAAKVHAPFLAAADPELLSVSSFQYVYTHPDISVPFEQPEFANWNRFRDSEEARYIGLCLPRVLLRLPYGSATRPISGFKYEESISGNDHRNYLWGNPAWALGTCITRSFAEHGWLACIRGVQGGGLVEGLPFRTFQNVDGRMTTNCPVEIALDDRDEMDLSDLGFIPLIHCRGREFAAFFSVPSCQRVRQAGKTVVNAGTWALSELHTLLCLSRLAHYLMVIARDKLGCFMDRESCESWLNMWLQSYLHPDPQWADQAELARMPLSEAYVQVVEIPGRPGRFQAIAHLNAHFQLNLPGAVSLRVQLPTMAMG